MTRRLNGGTRCSARADEVLDLLEGVAARHRRRVDHHRRRDVHVVGRRLQVQERRVQAAQALHRNRSSASLIGCHPGAFPSGRPMTRPGPSAD